jgi:demethylspheroidene O-methyltransferase
MAATQPAIAQEILDAYDFKPHRRLMDVGGGNGAFLLCAARRLPHLQLVLFDVPAVAELAAARFAEAGIANRATVAGGDFLKDLPQGADVISLIRVLLDHDDETALGILKSARAALPQGGVLLVAEPMAETRGAEKVAAYFSLYLMAMGRGRPRTEQQLQALLREAGFQRIERRSTCQPLLVRLLVAGP